MNHISAAIEELKQRRTQIDSAIAVLEKLAAELPVAAPVVAPPSAPKAKRKYQRRTKLVPLNGESRAELKRPATPPPSSQNSDRPEDNRELTALSAGAIAIGRTLNEPFTATDLSARLDGPRNRAYTWFAQWKDKGWIETVSFGAYRRKETFGE